MNEEKKESDLNNIKDNQTDDKVASENEIKSIEEKKESENNQANDEEKESEELKDPLKELKSELAETKDKLLRVLAENENIRKQSEKTRVDIIKYGVQPLARELVNVVDNFERAINSVLETTEKKTLEGFELIQKDITNILDKFNVKKIDALGNPFDANLHQAMFEKPTEEYEPGVVCEIVQDGYTFHDRLLRPAMVGISQKSEKSEEKNELEEETVEKPQKDELD
ncbi:MAG: Protein GrpE [Alphaproteobacteria bacterium MarineAlpha9_Bin4]|nr:nucleotide exchange factor GrpE [Pelagibacterales bacterium]PPR25576.1 MAG: Protein GrpE [Alphaproteobacteria bacterium MarineAlpha9_Bin4]